MGKIISNGINYSGGGANYQELTQAQYDALTTEQKNNGTIYFITDAESGGGSGGSSKELLWEYDNTYDITLAHDFTDYDFLIFEGQVYQGSECRGGQIISSTELESIRGVSNEKYTLVGALNKYANYLVVSKTSLTYYDGDSRVTRVWGIKLRNGGDSAPSQIDYSTTEQDTGIKWIDGKEIYQNTIQINSPSTSLDDIPNVSGIDTLVYVDGFLSSVYNSDKYIRHIDYQEGNTFALVVYQKADKLKYKTDFGGEFDRVAYITIQYTKTT